MKESLTDKVYRGLIKHILNMDYNVNELLNEQAVADEYHVSKTPAREALNRLCLEGFLVRYPSTGYFIKAMSMGECNEIFETRAILECGAIRIAVNKVQPQDIADLREIIARPYGSYSEYHEINAAFHIRLAEISRNNCLKDTVSRLINMSARPSPFTAYNPDRPPTNKWHEAIIAALEAGDGEAACKALYEDIQI